VAAALVAGFLIDVGLGLFLVPGLFLLARWSLVGPVIIVERRRPFDALRRSNAMVRGSTAVVLLLLAPGLFLTEVLIAETDVFAHLLGFPQAVADLCSALVAALLVPLFAIPVVLVYRSLAGIANSGTSSAIGLSPRTRSAPRRVRPSSRSSRAPRSTGTSTCPPRRSVPRYPRRPEACR